jgi:wengen protein
VLPKHLHKIGSPPSVSSAPFSATEELIWDWQAVALALAVFACLLFFIVACVYTVHHARQWRRLKDNFEDFEAG